MKEHQIENDPMIGENHKLGDAPASLCTKHEIFKNGQHHKLGDAHASPSTTTRFANLQTLFFEQHRNSPKLGASFVLLLVSVPPF